MNLLGFGGGYGGSGGWTVGDDLVDDLTIDEELLDVVVFGGEFIAGNGDEERVVTPTMFFLHQRCILKVSSSSSLLAKLLRREISSQVHQ